MCIAIYKPADKVLSDETLEACFENNPDGCGFAYINTDDLGVKKIVIKKTMEFETFLRQYKRAISIAPESPFLVHFRIRTHGETTTFNCHPFPIDDETVFIHNGIIKGVGFDQKKSDTQLFNEEILRKMPAGWLDNDGIMKLMSEFIDYSKLVIMNIDGDVTIVNESKGTWKEGVWYSNTSYTARTYTTYHNTSAGRGSTYNHNNNQHPRYGNNAFGHSKPTENSLRVGNGKVYTGKTYVQCDGCQKTYRALETMDIFYQVGTCSAFCKGCAAKLNVGSEGTDGELVSVECYAAWMLEMKADEMNNRATTFWTWSNPWTIEGAGELRGVTAAEIADQMMEQNQTFEEEEEAYQEQLQSGVSPY